MQVQVMWHDNCADQADRLINCTSWYSRHKGSKNDFFEVGSHNKKVHEEAHGHDRNQEGEEALELLSVMPE